MGARVSDLMQVACEVNEELERLPILLQVGDGRVHESMRVVAHRPVHTRSIHPLILAVSRDVVVAVEVGCVDEVQSGAEGVVGLVAHLVGPAADTVNLSHLVRQQIASQLGGGGSEQRLRETSGGIVSLTAPGCGGREEGAGGVEEEYSESEIERPRHGGDNRQLE